MLRAILTKEWHSPSKPSDGIEKSSPSMVTRSIALPARSAKSSRLVPAILNFHERIENKLFLDRTRKDSNFKRPHICATLFQIEKCWSTTRRWPRTARSASGQIGLHHRMDLFALAAASAQPPDHLVAWQ